MTVLVGTKADLTNKRVVKGQEGLALAKKHKMGYYEVSSKDNKNIKELFYYILFRSYIRFNDEKNESKITKINLYPSEKKKSKCLRIIKKIFN